MTRQRMRGKKERRRRRKTEREREREREKIQSLKFCWGFTDQITTGQLQIYKFINFINNFVYN
jgi:hypothetical protein